MSDLPENVDLQWIGRFLLGMQDRLRTIGDDIAELKTDLREIRGRVAILEANYASVSFRVDRLGDRLDRIERGSGWWKLNRLPCTRQGAKARRNGLRTRRVPIRAFGDSVFPCGAHARSSFPPHVAAGAATASAGSCQPSVFEYLKCGELIQRRVVREPAACDNTG